MLYVIFILCFSIFAIIMCKPARTAGGTSTASTNSTAITGTSTRTSPHTGEATKTQDSKDKDKDVSMGTIEEKEKKEKSEKRAGGGEPGASAAKSPHSSQSKEADPSRTKAKDPKDVNRKLWAKNAMEMKPKQIAEEFMEKGKKYVAPNMTAEAHAQNDLKNRYRDVLCLDKTRVVLRGRKEDYIHASWVTIPEQGNKYICTQGPLAETIEDFWWMIIQEQAKIVLMLCKLVENDSEKCVAYWPPKVGDEAKYGSISVKNVESKDDVVPGTERTILTVSGPNGKVSVEHLFVTDWPDHLAPASPSSVVKLYQYVKKNSDDKPVVVHCSAGVGRTSTFVGIDYANVRISADGNIQLVDVIKEMRAQRFQAMQSHVQFMFLLVCLLEYFAQESVIPRDEKFKSFLSIYERHARKKMSKVNKSKEEIKAA